MSTQTILQPIFIREDEDSSDENIVNYIKLSKIYDNGVDHFQYILYPFDQCKELSLTKLGVYDSELKSLHLEDYCLYGFTCEWIDGLSLVHDTNNYIIKRGDDVVSILYDTQCHYQLGDGDTCVYLWKNKHIVVQNNGDISSVVIIKRLTENDE
jgi:hypothetical protein